MQTCRIGRKKFSPLVQMQHFSQLTHQVISLLNLYVVYLSVFETILIYVVVFFPTEFVTNSQRVLSELAGKVVI